MGKHIFLFLFYLLAGEVLGCAQQTKAVRELIQRVSGRQDIPVSLKLKQDKDSTYYQYEVQDGTLRIQASDNVSLCRGFYDYIKDNQWGMYTWSGNSITVPGVLPDQSFVRTVSPFSNHYYFKF